MLGIPATEVLEVKMMIRPSEFRGKLIILACFWSFYVNLMLGDFYSGNDRYI